MKKLAFILPLLAPTAAFAVEGAPYTYLGGGGSAVAFDSDGLSSDANLGGFYLKVGHMFTDEFGLEARALTTNDDSASLKDGPGMQ